MRGLLLITLAATLLGSSIAARAASDSKSAVIGTADNSLNNSAIDSVAGEKANITASRPAAVAANASAPAKSELSWLKDSKTGCAVSALGEVDADRATWSGSCLDGFADGPGTSTLARNGKLLKSFTAEFEKGLPHDGHAEIKWADGSHYTGDVVALRMEGPGILTTAAGDRFEGHWAGGHMNGQGTAHWANGDEYDGNWQDGRASGYGVQIWADGHKYEGNWQNDLPNGHGLVTRNDGSRYEADFVDGRATHLVELAAAVPDSGMVHSATAVVPAEPNPQSHDSTAKPSNDNDDTADSDDDAAPAATQPAAISAIAGKKLYAVDGSSLILTLSDDGLTREIVAPNGSAKQSTFVFLNEKLGSVSEGGNNIVGVFRLTKEGIATEYGDGRSELLFPNTDGGISIRSSASSGEATCAAWYPEGHHFSLPEREAALAAYASHLGLQEPSGKKQKHAPKPSCGSIATFDADADSEGLPSKIDVEGKLPSSSSEVAHADKPSSAGATLNSDVASEEPSSKANVEGKLQPSSKEVAHASKPTSARAASPTTVNFALPARHDQPVEVRPSVVHPIDSDAPAISPSGTNMAANEPAVDANKNSASACLTVESDGQHWAFRNHCGYDVQFAYCLMNSADPLADCSKGGISGSVSPNGSSALVSDRSLSETNADHDFRWVACNGGAGEVVAHLDRSDPPQGRCVRPQSE